MVPGYKQIMEISGKAEIKMIIYYCDQKVLEMVALN